VLTLFIGLMAVCGLALVWLGWQVLVNTAPSRRSRGRSA
jgi:threonine/homoserine/homoserine lactone efflux protein